MRLLLLCVLVALPLAGVSNQLVELLGPRHTHAVAAVDAGMQGWTDFRRSHDAGGEGPRAARVAQHGAVERHRHGSGLDGVERLDTEGDDGAGGPVAVVLAPMSVAIATSVPALQERWDVGVAMRFGTRGSPPPERPPRG